MGDNNNSKRLLAMVAMFVLAFAGIAGAGCSSDSTEQPTPGETDTGNDVADTGTDSVPEEGVDIGTDTGADTQKPPTDPTATPSFNPPGDTYAAPQDVKITSTTPGAVIYYTVDGTKPNVSSAKYAAPISIAKTTTVKAMALAPGFLPSEIASATYTIEIPSGTVLPVEFTPAAGTYENDQTVALTTGTGGATICYTLDGSAPACDAPTATCGGSSATYSGSAPVLINTTGRAIRAIACKTGFTTSAVTTATYTLTAAAAKFSPSGGTFDGPIALTATLATAGATVRYTIDGTNPDCTTIGATFISGALTISSNTTLKAITCKPGYNPSVPQTIDYNFRHGRPTIDPASGERTNQTSATMTAVTPPPGVTDAITCFTTDATKAPTCVTSSPPTCGTDSTKYASPLSLDKATTIRAVSCSSRTLQSPEATVSYTFKVAKPTIAPPDATTWPFAGNPTVATTTVNTGSGATANNVRIYWTIDTTAPNCATPPSGSACRPGATTATTCTCGVGVSSCSVSAADKAAMTAGSTLNVIACKTDYTPSELATATYPPVGTLPNPVFSPNGGVDLPNDQAVTITQGGPADATLCYTSQTTTTAPDPDCDAAGVCTVGTAYDPSSKPITRQSGEFLKARTCKAGSTKSSVATSGTFSFKVADPIAASPAALPPCPTCTYPWGTPVRFGSVTMGAEFHWVAASSTTGATPPTCTTGSVGTYTIRNGSDFGDTLAVVGCKPGYAQSSFYVYQFYKSSGLGAPTFSPPSGDITNIPTVKVSSVSGAAPGFKICYTTDGSVPSCDPVKVCECSGVGCVVNSASDGMTWTPTTTGETIRAMACSASLANSPVSSATYTFRSSAPMFAPPAVAWSAAANYASGAFVQYGNTTYKSLKTTGPAFGGAVTPGTDSATWEAQSSLSVTVGLDPADTAGGKTVASKLCFRLNAAPTFKTPSPTEPDCQPNDTETKCNDGGAGVPADTSLTLTSTTTIFATSCRAGFTKTTTSATYNIAPRWHTINMANATNDFTAEEAFATSASGATAYMTWDQDRIYLGFQGAEFAGANIFHVYLSGAPSDSTVTATPETGFGGTPLPFANATWHFHYRADGADTATKNWNGVGWGSATVTTQVQQGGAGATSFVKVALLRSDLGLAFSAPEDPIIRAVGAVWDAASGTNVGVFPGTTPFAKYIESSLKDSRAPNASAHIKP